MISDGFVAETIKKQLKVDWKTIKKRIMTITKITIQFKNYYYYNYTVLKSIAKITIHWQKAKKINK